MVPLGCQESQPEVHPIYVTKFVMHAQFVQELRERCHYRQVENVAPQVTEGENPVGLELVAPLSLLCERQVRLTIFA